MNHSATTSAHAAHVARRRDPCPKGDPDAPRADQRDTTQGGEHGPRGRGALSRTQTPNRISPVFFPACKKLHIQNNRQMSNLAVIALPLPVFTLCLSSRMPEIIKPPRIFVDTCHLSRMHMVRLGQQVPNDLDSTRTQAYRKLEKWFAGGICTPVWCEILAAEWIRDKELNRTRD